MILRYSEYDLMSSFNIVVTSVDMVAVFNGDRHTSKLMPKNVAKIIDSNYAISYFVTVPV